MKLNRHSSADELLGIAGPWLIQGAAENNLILGVASRARSYETGEGPLAYWASIRDGGQIVGCAFRTPPFPVNLTAMPSEAIPLLVEDIGKSHSMAPGVIGPVPAAELFAELWSARFGLTAHCEMRLRIHRLDQVIFPPDAPAGSLRQPHASEHPLVHEWVDAFATDIGSNDDPAENANRLLETGNIGIWDDEGPRCMVAAGREIPGGIGINLVYTPSEHRGCGYASIAVAAFSQLQLDSGKKFCCLYTDRDNPTPNSIYAKIGYVPIRDDLHINFVNDPEEKETG
jgi:hypothetical protein